MVAQTKEGPINAGTAPIMNPASLQSGNSLVLLYASMLIPTILDAFVLFPGAA